MVIRLVRHLTCGPALKRHFDAATLLAIEKAISASELQHGGQIRCVIEPGLDIGPLLKKQTARSRALELFASLGVWDTAHNNGALIYLLLADQAVEIITDRGIDFSPEELPAVCRAMESEFAQGRFQAGIELGIKALGARLTRDYPATSPNHNELADTPLLL